MDVKPMQDMDIKSKTMEENIKPQILSNDTQMTSSTISTISSLASPADSGVQLLDSESDVTSVSGFGCENDIPSDNVNKTCKNSEENVDLQKNYEGGLHIKNYLAGEKSMNQSNDKEKKKRNASDTFFSSSVPEYFDRFSIQEIASAPNLTRCSQTLNDEVFEMEHPIKSNTEADLMNLSLNSYELLDYTLQNANLDVATIEPVDMHVSMSEEVNENLKVNTDTNENITQPVIENIPIVEQEDAKPAEEQIVFRRQRKKKSKSDTPKKRVSFHEDILNSTKIDDIHINHGFITHEEDMSLSFFQRGFVKRPDVVKGRYSWAAEGDAPYYEKSASEREIKSDIYMNSTRFSSTSSSSTGSVSSSIDEEDTSDENAPKREPSSQKLPKSSCLKKTKPKKYLNTNIVHEENNIPHRKGDSILPDTNNIFGSLKNILSFSTSVPLAERGVPEGQEDVAIYSSSHDISSLKRRSSNLLLTNFEAIEVQAVPEPNAMTQAKNNLKLTRSEGFYPNYVTNQAELPSNIILCDSNVYEHKGISYSYEYDNFQKNFEKENTPRSSTIYETILREFNFFRRRPRDQDHVEDFEVINPKPTHVSQPQDIEEKAEDVKEASETKQIPTTPKNPMNKYGSSTKLDWSDTETVSEIYEANSRHLSSPKRKVNRNNHYAIQPSFKSTPVAEDLTKESDLEMSKSLPALRASSSKSSLINRFLKNVTLKKLLDAKIQNKQKIKEKSFDLCVKYGGARASNLNCNNDINKDIEMEVSRGQEKMKLMEMVYDKKMIINFRKSVFRNRHEKLIRVFPVRSAYRLSGETKALLAIVTDSTLYITSTDTKFEQKSYQKLFVLPYTELNTMLIGPHAQTIHFANYDKDMQFVICTGCAQITSDLVGQVEMAMRRDYNKPKLPAVKQLSMVDMANLRSAICRQTSVCKDEEYFYYSIVNMQDFDSTIAPTPLGPTKEGPLMFKTADSDSARWETAYFILKAGVLYMLSSASQRLPMKVFPLINGACQGARRIFNSVRPHTFQVIVENKSLLLAAPDEYVASEWLQELIHAASGLHNLREKSPTQSCSLLMTSEHILTIRESFPDTFDSLPGQSQQDLAQNGNRVLSYAAIANLTSFRLPSAEQSWCILEFACREVHEYSGDWILYFASNAELENFISTLEMLWQYNNEHGDSFPISTLPETDPLSKKCVDVYNLLLGSWTSNTVFLQFL